MVQHSSPSQCQCARALQAKQSFQALDCNHIFPCRVKSRNSPFQSCWELSESEGFHLGGWKEGTVCLLCPRHPSDAHQLQQTPAKQAANFQDDHMYIPWDLDSGNSLVLSTKAASSGSEMCRNISVTEPVQGTSRSLEVCVQSATTGPGPWLFWS